MTREERRALLGDQIIEHIHACVDAAPDPTPEVVAKLRRIMTNPAGAGPVDVAYRIAEAEVEAERSAHNDAA